MSGMLPFYSLILYFCSHPPNQTHSTLIITSGEKTEKAQNKPKPPRGHRFSFLPTNLRTSSLTGLTGYSDVHVFLPVSTLFVS